MARRAVTVMTAAAVAWPLVLGAGVPMPAAAEHGCVLEARAAATPVAATPLPASTPKAQAAWLGMDLTDVCTEDVFRLGAFPGSIVYVHPMGTW